MLILFALQKTIGHRSPARWGDLVSLASQRTAQPGQPVDTLTAVDKRRLT
jgi:hypothetical protein